MSTGLEVVIYLAVLCVIAIANWQRHLRGYMQPFLSYPVCAFVALSSLVLFWVSAHMAWIGSSGQGIESYDLPMWATGGTAVILATLSYYLYPS